MSVVLVVAPHPDDETLGCGGTLLRHIAEGDQVHWLIMTRITEDLGFSAERVLSRNNEIKEVANQYQFELTHYADFDTMALDRYSKGQLINKISDIMNLVMPEIIYVPYRLDAHSDHTAVFDSVMSCTKSFRYPFVKCVRAYETLSETDFGLRPEDGGFRPNFFVNISDFLDVKIDIMKLYQGEMAPHPFPRSEQSLRALATLRGVVAGCHAAESFMTLREII